MYKDHYSYMINLYSGWSTQIAKALANQPHNCDLDKNYRNISSIYCYGMGGSGVPCDVLYISSLVHGSRFRVYRYKNTYIDRDAIDKANSSAIILISYSGNTPEILKVFRSYINEGNIEIAVVSSGGAIGTIAKEKKTLYYEIIDKNIPPRLALPSLIIGMLKCLSCMGIDTSNYIEELNYTARKIDEDEVLIDSLSKSISIDLYKAVSNNADIVILSKWIHKPLIYRFSTELAENSKIRSIIGVFPEAGHNLIATIQNMRPIHILYIHDHGDKESETILQFLYDNLSNNHHISVLEAPRDLSYLGKIIYLSLIAGITSVKLAEKLNIDPLDIDMIKRYRKISEKLNT